MTDQRPSNPRPALNRNDRYILGAVVFGALLIGFLLYSTRNHDEPSNQGGIVSAPETPAIPGGKK